MWPLARESSQRPGEVEVKTSLHRRFVGRTFALFVNLFASVGIADTQCGFKMFRREAAAAIFSRQKTVGFAFDVEILFIARRLGLTTIEIPVNWVSGGAGAFRWMNGGAIHIEDFAQIFGLS